MDGTQVSQERLPRTGFSARTTIGVMIDNVDEDFQRAIWAGLESAAKEAGVNVVNFLGGDLNPNDPALDKRNAIYGLVTPASVQGLVIASTVMATYLGNERLDAHCRRFRPLPMVSLGFQLGSMPSVICDSQLGLKDLIEHLIDRHGRQRFMYLGGTESNADSVERERIFHETLAARGIAADPRLVARANFRPDRAYALVRQAHDQGVPFDAVVAANDEMAIAALDALDDMGIRIPDDVSVTGFDDILSASRLSLPLTTVRQPTFELSRRAMQVLLGMLKGEQPPPAERHPTQVVIRRSCGCFSESVQRAGEGRAKPRRQSAVALTPTPNLTEVILAALRKEDVASLGPLGRENVETLVQAFADEVAGTGVAGAFLSRLDTSLRANYAQELGEDMWEDFVTILRRETGGRVLPSAEARAETLLHQGRVLVKEAARQQQWKAQAHLTRQIQSLQYALDYLAGAFDVPRLLDLMARELPRVGIRRCYLAVHASPEHAWEEARLLLAYDQAGRKPVPREGIPFPAARLLPDGIVDRNDRVNLICQPLASAADEFGFMAMELNPREEISSFAVAGQIRSSLQASMLAQGTPLAAVAPGAPRRENP
jgi:sigma-B regulation protein RsbU (phosphoserine phosphatase)